MFTPLTDDSPMPFGKYGPKGEGRLMKDVPAQYLHWLWTESGMKDDGGSPVSEYIKQNLACLLAEYPDGEWE